MLRLANLPVTFVILLTLVGCQSITIAHRPHGRRGPVAQHPGPPPHAPAHGYRHKHEGGAELRYDSGLGVYVVLGETDVYFDDDGFIRIRNGVWEVSANLDGPWQSCREDTVPVALRSKSHAKHKHSKGKGDSQAKAKGKGKGHAPAKPAW